MNQNTFFFLETNVSSGQKNQSGKSERCINLGVLHGCQTLFHIVQTLGMLRIEYKVTKVQEPEGPNLLYAFVILYILTFSHMQKWHKVFALHVI